MKGENIEGESFEVDPSKVESFFDLYDSKDPYSIPLIFLDEFPKHVEDNPFARLMRNILRASGAVVLIMGTNSSGKNMFEASAGSRGSDKWIRWCKVITRLPKTFITESQTIALQDKPLVLEIARHSRPWFARRLIEYMTCEGRFETVNNFDEAFAFIFEVVSDAKEFKYHVYSILGQYSLLLNHFSYHSINLLNSEEKEDIQDAFINFHFPVSTREKSFHVLRQNRELYDEDMKALKDSLCFPPSKDDCLLHLCFSGGKNDLPVFPVLKGDEKDEKDEEKDEEVMKKPEEDKKDEKKGLTIMDFIKKYRSKFERSYNRNSEQKSNTGLALEAFCCALIAVCSRKNGIAGIPATMFLKNLLEQLNITSVQTYPGEVDLNFLIPFFSLPNSEFPDFLKESPLFNVMYLERLENREKLDGRSACKALTFECKDRDSLSNEDLKNIFSRIPPTSKLHLVFLKKIANYQEATVSIIVDYMNSEEGAHLKDFHIEILKQFGSAWKFVSFFHRLKNEGQNSSKRIKVKKEKLILFVQVEL